MEAQQKGITTSPKKVMIKKLNTMRPSNPARDYEAEMKRLKHEKVALGIRYEQEQESIVNRLVRQLKSTKLR